MTAALTIDRRDASTDRIAALDWACLVADLDGRGFAVIPHLLAEDECADVVALYDGTAGFRKRVIMAHHGYGRGEYKYFAYPLPDLVAGLRQALYPYLAPIANRWHEAMGLDVRFPDELEAFLRRCHDAGQCRPTPLILRYGAGDYNCLHQDLYAI